jgi:hypothetical protein
LENIKQLAVGPYLIRVTCDLDDRNRKLEEYCSKNNIQLFYGESSGKVNAINRDMDFVGAWDILVNLSDDQKFTKKGFDDVIRECFKEEDVFLHIFDGNRKDFSTMSIMDLKYYNRDGFIYNPVYKSLSCDVEATEVAKIRGRYRYCDEKMMVHSHPAFRKGRVDELYRINNKYAAQDVQTYVERSQHNFYL